MDAMYGQFQQIMIHLFGCCDAVLPNQQQEGANSPEQQVAADQADVDATLDVVQAHDETAVHLENL